MAKVSNWTCPVCQRDQIVADTQQFGFRNRLQLGFHKYPNHVAVDGHAIACSNEKCGEVQLKLDFFKGEFLGGSTWQDFETIETFTRPSSFAKPQPVYIPQALRDDYLEACKIRDLSPKASATLARRCLQTMIRDFCGITGEKTLFAEIQALKKLIVEDKAPRGVSVESVDAIDHVRSIGNIGAHMEKDIDLIIDVDAGEAQILIELIETLFDEWYVERQQRTERFANLKSIADKKAAMKKSSQPAEAAYGAPEKDAE